MTYFSANLSSDTEIRDAVKFSVIDFKVGLQIYFFSKSMRDTFKSLNISAKSWTRN